MRIPITHLLVTYIPTGSLAGRVKKVGWRHSTERRWWEEVVGKVWEAVEYGEVDVNREEWEEKSTLLDHGESRMGWRDT